ncbi:hypothetical protein QNM99_22620 [Pseudomonas sp. PCH446]
MREKHQGTGFSRDRSSKRSVFAVGLEAVCGLVVYRLLGSGLWRVFLLSLVQAWEGEVGYLMHRRRSSQGLFFKSLGRSALLKKPGQDTAGEMTERFFRPGFDGHSSVLREPASRLSQFKG